MPQDFVKTFYVVTSLPLSLLLAGCATTSPPSVSECPPIPSKPVSVTSAPSVTYSQSAATDISRWRETLINASATSKP